MRTARDLAPRFRGPVVFVPLARVDDADEAVHALAVALQLDGMIGTWDQAAEALESQNALVVWDNAEHLPGLADRLAMLRDRCGRVHALVTSRRSLAVAGEQLYPVEPLEQAASVDLLVDRALLQQPRFDVAASEPKLRQVARRLDGLPLALELAAARLRSLPLEALLDRLDRQLDLLADTGRGPVGRHQTMRNALQWSYDLVEPNDRELFAALSGVRGAGPPGGGGPRRGSGGGCGAGWGDAADRRQPRPPPGFARASLLDAQPARQFAAELLAVSIRKCTGPAPNAGVVSGNGGGHQAATVSALPARSGASVRTSCVRSPTRPSWTSGRPASRWRTTWWGRRSESEARQSPSCSG